LGNSIDVTIFYALTGGRGAVVKIAQDARGKDFVFCKLFMYIPVRVTNERFVPLKQLSPLSVCVCVCGKGAYRFIFPFPFPFLQMQPDAAS